MLGAVKMAKTSTKKTPLVKGNGERGEFLWGDRDRGYLQSLAPFSVSIAEFIAGVVLKVELRGKNSSAERRTVSCSRVKVAGVRDLMRGEKKIIRQADYKTKETRETRG